MESGLKQRLIGAAVLVALAVIFLPMLVQGTAPDSGVSDLPLQMPDQPAGEYETRDLPLVTPGATSTDGVLDNDDALPTVDTATAPPAADAPATSAPPDEPRHPTQCCRRPPPAAITRSASVPTAAAPTPTPWSRACARRNCPAIASSHARRQARMARAHRTVCDPRRSESARIAAKEVRDIDARVIALDADEAAPATPAAPAATATAPAAKPAEPAPAAPSRRSRPLRTSASRAARRLQQARRATVLRDRVRAAGMNAFTDPYRPTRAR